MSESGVVSTTMSLDGALGVSANLADSERATSASRREAVRPQRTRRPSRKARENGEDDDDDVDDKFDDDVVNDDSGDDVDDAAGGQKETRVYRQWNKAEKRVLTHAATAIVEAYYDPKLKKKKDRQYALLERWSRTFASYVLREYEPATTSATFEVDTPPVPPARVSQLRLWPVPADDFMSFKNGNALAEKRLDKIATAMVSHIVTLAGKQFKKETAKKTGNDTVELDNSQLALALRRVWELNEDLKVQVEGNKLKADAEAAKKNSRAEAAQELHERQIRLIKIAGENVATVGPDGAKPVAPVTPAVAPVTPPDEANRSATSSGSMSSRPAKRARNDFWQVNNTSQVEIAKIKAENRLQVAKERAETEKAVAQKNREMFEMFLTMQKDMLSAFQQSNRETTREMMESNRETTREMMETFKELMKNN